MIGSRAHARGLRTAAAVVQRGGTVAYPTEAVFGVGCDPWDLGAVARVVQAKRRDQAKGLILIAAWPAAFIGLVAGVDLAVLPDATLEAEASGRATTFVVRAAPSAPALLTGGRTTLAVRLTTHPLAAQLCRSVGGPIVSTSANRSGLRAARTAVQARRWLGDRVDYVLGGAVGSDPRPSRIIDLASGEVLRA